MSTPRRPKEIREGAVSIGAYLVLFIAWLYGVTIVLLNRNILNHAGGHHTKVLVLDGIFIVLVVAAVFIVYQIVRASKSCLNTKTGVRTFWNLPLFPIQVMQHPYYAGRYEPDFKRSVPEPDYAAIIAGGSCFLLAATAIPGWVPQPSVLGLDNLGVAWVFSLVGAIMFSFAYACAEHPNYKIG